MEAMVLILGCMAFGAFMSWLYMLCVGETYNRYKMDDWLDEKIGVLANRLLHGAVIGLVIGLGILGCVWLLV